MFVVARANMADDRGESLFFLVLNNANRQSVTPSLETDGGKALSRKLAARSDAPGTPVESTDDSSLR